MKYSANDKLLGIVKERVYMCEYHVHTQHAVIYLSLLYSNSSWIKAFGYFSTSIGFSRLKTEMPYTSTFACQTLQNQRRLHLTIEGICLKWQKSQIVVRKFSSWSQDFLEYKLENIPLNSFEHWDK